MPDHDDQPPSFGSEALRLPDALRPALKQHMARLRAHYHALQWGVRTGFGQRPALIVIDLALAWTDPDRQPYGSNVDTVVEASCRLLEAARRAGIPIFFTTSPHDPAGLPTPPSKSALAANLDADDLQLDPRLDRRENEKIIYKHYASSFKGTNLTEMLCALNPDPDRRRRPRRVGADRALRLLRGRRAAAGADRYHRLGRACSHGLRASQRR